MYIPLILAFYLIWSVTTSRISLLSIGARFFVPHIVCIMIFTNAIVYTFGAKAPFIVAWLCSPP